MNIPTLLRRAEHKVLSSLTMEGNILDLGGDDRSAYRRMIKGSHTFTTVNLDTASRPDILHDLEQPLPIADASYDHVLLINVLEHVYEYRQLLSEASRVVRPGGSVVLIVPFLFPLHPSPSDFWRFSAEALRRECMAVGLSVEEVKPLGGGVFASCYVMFDRLLPTPLRFVGCYTLRPCILFLERVFTRIARMLSKKYQPEDYALGYSVHAKKQS